MSLGFQMAGYHVGLGLDFDSLACETHAYNFDNRCEVVDITSIEDPSAYVQQHGVNSVDVLIGGPPCQGFSRVGRGKMRRLKNDPSYIHDPRNQLYLHFLRFIETLHPAYFVIENVPDMRYYEDGQGLLIDNLFNELGKMKPSYSAEWRILLAADYGVPQLRHRLFIVGNRLGLPVNWPEHTHQEERYVTVWDAISDLPIVDIKHRADVIPYASRTPLTEYQELMRRGSGNELYNHQTRWHNQDDLRAFELLPEGGRYIDLPDELRRYDSKQHPDQRNKWFRDRYRKLIRNQPSWTVEAHIGKDTYRHIYPSRAGEPEPPRTVSVREAARLQSFPDNFRFRGPFTQQFRQVGNAVPPLLALALAKAIRNDVMDNLQATKETG